MGAAEYNPWRRLAARADIELRWARLPDCYGGAAAVVDGGRRFIVLDPRLNRTERRAAIEHELVHHERGVPASTAPALLRAKDEHAVRVEVARRLVPLDELRTFAAQRSTVGPVTATDVAEAFDVPEDVARLACELVS